MTSHPASDFEGTQYDYTINHDPDECPHCHYALIPDFIHGVYTPGQLFLSYICVRNDCRQFFLVNYIPTNINGQFYLNRYILGTPKNTNITSVIKTISADFVKINNQAQTAQDAGLADICGMGFRKALEYLIKDYIIYRDKSLKSVIDKKSLGDCIKHHIESDMVKEIASRASWLGNDETHYNRKWEGMDVNVLKQLITLTLHWIEAEDLSKKMIANMPEPKKK